ncbi:SDR family NAD(P)-dependent oxidoreductase [Marinobacter sp. SS21]|uniref:SDR family NAD(P)-dependent oxidoreductase n=1 Tax=Marinobacter sp. SS21 TaxID=2979460 RepID=UPI0023303FEC|nr:SDR family NAD(P)-dependent oxidoreductase [Marinobacter sp. SS21]MDC0661110.1 SDR family NAD(P)-dependent oxidoreductase [Marinobacter sp. SS21]
MDNMNHKIILITGAGSGIGRETALEFARHGAYIILVDINRDGLEESARLIAQEGGESEIHECDVSSREAMSRLAETVNSRHKALDVLINNAGIGSAGRFLGTSLDTWEKVLDVNLMGVVHGCHFFAPQMVEKGNGGSIVNVASALAFAGTKEMPVYAASKFAVLGFSESLRADLAEYGLHVATICPGIINTAIVGNTVFEGELASGDRAQKSATSLYQRRNYPPQKVAKAIFGAVVKRKSVVPVSPEAWMLYYGKRLAPSLIERLVRLDAPI